MAYEALENSGVILKDIDGSRISVFVSTFTRDYERHLYKDPCNLPRILMTGIGEAIVSNRISQFFNLKGPSVTMDTGCSGSLVALHQACQSLRTYESSMSLVRVINLILGQDQTIALSNTGSALYLDKCNYSI